MEAGGTGAEWASPAVARRGDGRADGAAPRLSQVGVPEEGIPDLVEGAMGDGLTLLNPREPTEEDYEKLFKEAL